MSDQPISTDDNPNDSDIINPWHVDAINDWRIYARNRINYRVYIILCLTFVLTGALFCIPLSLCWSPKDSPFTCLSSSTYVRQLLLICKFC